MHRLGVALVGRPHVIAPRRIDVLLHAEALLVQRSEPEHGRHGAGLRCAIVPFRGFAVIDGDAFALGIADADFKRRRGVAVERGGSQCRTADAVGEGFRTRNRDRRQRVCPSGMDAGAAGIVPVTSAGAVSGWLAGAVSDTGLRLGPARCCRTAANSSIAGRAASARSSTASLESRARVWLLRRRRLAALPRAG